MLGGFNDQKMKKSYKFYLISKSSDRRCLVGSFKRKLAFCKTTTKAMLKPSFELLALVILRVPPVLTVALLNLFLS